jgi:ubiquinone/menaquinone biosynthesis C-methylase UbiE
MGKDRTPYVNRLFSNVHHTYDLATHTLSFGQDHAWKAKLIAPLHGEMMSVKASTVIADLACGTGDITSMLHPDGVDLYETVYAIDINEDMTGIMRSKLKEIRVEYVLKSCDQQYAEPGSIDHSFASYCFRNLPSWKTGLHRAYDSLRDGGVIHVLDMFRPMLFPQCRLRLMHLWCKANDALLNKCSPVYAYIPHSVENFASCDEFVDFATEIGFICVERIDLFFGFASIVRLQKPTNRFKLAFLDESDEHLEE